MTPRPKHAKVDSSQPQMVKELRRLGFCVIITARIGGKTLDLFVGGWRPLKNETAWLHVEVKEPGKRDDLTGGERAFFEEWGHLPAIVAEYPEDVVDWFMGGQE